MSFSFTYDFNFLLRPFWHDFFFRYDFCGMIVFHTSFSVMFFLAQIFQKHIFMHILFDDVFRMTVFATIIFGRLFWE